MLTTKHTMMVLVDMANNANK